MKDIKANKNKTKNKKLPKWLQGYLPSYDISKMSLDNPGDKEEIITQILNNGTMEDVVWLFKTYKSDEIKKVVATPMRGCWDERALNYWTKIFNIKIHPIIYGAAIFSLDPRPQLMKSYFKIYANK